jgi:hypothetical protein
LENLGKGLRGFEKRLGLEVFPACFVDEILGKREDHGTTRGITSLAIPLALSFQCIRRCWQRIVCLGTMIGRHVM